MPRPTLEAEGARARKKLVQNWFVRDLRPRAVARGADEELVAIVAEPEPDGDLQQFDRRAGIAIGNRMAVVKMPEPDVLRKVAFLEQAVLRVGQRAPSGGELRAAG